MSMKIYASQDWVEEKIAVIDIPSAVPIDTTLSIERQAADAKAVGDAIGKTTVDIATLTTNVEALQTKVGDSSVSEQISNALEAKEFVVAPSTAAVGQLLIVKTADESGKPTEWETKAPATIFEEFGFSVNEDGTLVGGSASSGGASVVVDTELSTTSTNPVQNSVITNKITEIEIALGSYINDIDTLIGGDS